MRWYAGIHCNTYHVIRMVLHTKLYGLGTAPTTNRLKSLSLAITNKRECTPKPSYPCQPECE